MRWLVLAPALVACTSESALRAFDPEDPPPLRVIGTSADGLATPRDLQFNPDSPADLWTVNRETDAVVIYFAAGTDEQTTLERDDSMGFHFMEEVSSMAFGQHGVFATAQESRNTYDGQSPPNNFMGPALWSSDLEILAESHQGSGQLGSHIDMLHESPLAMGIAWEDHNIYWVFDGWNDDLVRYDFQLDHGPGMDDHSDGIVRRFDVEVERLPDVPSHMERDPVTGLLYMAHSATGEVWVVDASTAAHDRDLPLLYEPLEEYSAWTGTTVDVLAGGLAEPSGVALDGDVLYVGDHATGEIIGFSTASGEELGRLQTDAEALMGLAVSEDGRLWYVDGAANEVVLVDHKVK